MIEIEMEHPQEITKLGLASQISSLLEGTDRLIVGISGYGGSGKSTLARFLAQQIKGCKVVGTDEFWIPELDVRSTDWSAIDRSRLKREVLLPFRAGDGIRYSPYDWSTGKPRGVCTIDQCCCLIVEGIGLFHHDLKPLFDLTVWMDCPLSAATERGIRRDCEEYGVDTEEIWRTVWAPNDAEFFERFRPDLAARYLTH